MTRIRVKICCIASVAEAEMAVAAGADLLGFVGPMPTGPGPIDLATARRIVRQAPPWAGSVLLTAAETAEGILAEVQAAGVGIVQIVRHIDPAEHTRLAAMAPRLARLQVLHVEGMGVLDTLAGYAGRVDGYLLDSGRPAIQELGGTGRVHDWAVSAAVVAAADRPVWLAGGLTPQNVGEAIARVRPFGVDLCTGVRPQGALDAERLAEFMLAVAEAGL